MLPPSQRGADNVRPMTRMESGGAAVRTAARNVLKHGVRQIGVATSSLRPVPDFLIIGAKRGGTTSFYYDLLEHPAVMRLFPPPFPGLKMDATKGAHFFDSNFFRGERWYRSYMPTIAARRIVSRHEGLAVVGEASPYYLFHPAAAQRAHQVVPEARVIVLLRDPAMRTYSHWKERRRNHAEELDFLSALAAEPARLAGERQRLLDDPTYTSYAWEQQSYAAQSRYVESLRPWIQLFGRGRVCIVASEDYYSDPSTVLREVLDFLGLPGLHQPSGRVRNAAPGAELPEGLRAELATTFAGPNRELMELVGRGFPWT